MKKLSAVLALISPRRLLAVASLCTVTGLIFMVAPGLVESPLFLIASLTMAHALGLGGVILFGASVLQEVLTKSSLTARSTAPAPPPTDPTSAEPHE